MGRSPEPVLNGFHHYGSVDRLYILHSANNEEERIAHIAIELKKRLAGTGFNEVILKEINAFDMNNIINAILEIVEKEEPPFYINITGGTNMMAGAACAASFFVGAKAYYVQGKRQSENSSYKVIELPVPNIPYYKVIGKSELSILECLRRLGGKCTTPQMKSILKMSPQIISYHIRELQIKSLIEVDNPESKFMKSKSEIKKLDRRVKTIKITNAGLLFLRWTKG